MAHSSSQRSAVPLCVDLDGTLLRTDLTLESLLHFAKKHPRSIVLFPFWLLRGRAYLKRRLNSPDMEVQTLPFHPDFLSFLIQERRRGRRLLLVTGSDQDLAERVAEHLQIFDAVVGSDGSRNLTGRRKAQLLKAKFEGKDFAYAGNAWVDAPVWRAASEAVLVDASARLQATIRKHSTVTHVFGEKRVPFDAIWRAIRPHHMTKNLLVFVPFITAHKFGDVSALGQAFLAFVSFSLATSGTYLLNDLLDLPADRRHPVKKDRPFASGALSLLWGLFVAPVLMGASLLLAFMAPHPFLSVMGSYILLTTAYSLYLKEVVMLDVMTLGVLYTLRLLAGAKAIQVQMSPWLLLFSMFWFLSLAVMKRYRESSLASKGDLEAGARGYLGKDLPMLATLGMTSGFVAVLVFALYADSAMVSALYLHPRRLWSICLLLLYWIGRAWLLVQRGEVSEDPIRFALSDRQSYAIGILAATLFWVSGVR